MGTCRFTGLVGNDESHHAITSPVESFRNSNWKRLNKFRFEFVKPPRSKPIGRYLSL